MELKCFNILTPEIKAHVNVDFLLGNEKSISLKKILRLLKYQCDEKISNTISSNKRPISLRLEGLPIILTL